MNESTRVRPTTIKADAPPHHVDPLEVGDIRVLGKDLRDDLQAVIRAVLR